MRRVITKLILFVALGLATTLLVAWASVRMEPMGREQFGVFPVTPELDRAQQQLDDELWWHAWRWREVTGTSYYSYGLWCADETHEDMTDISLVLGDIPDLLTTPPEAEFGHRFAHARGWPMRAVWFEVIWNDEIGRHVVGGITVPWDPYRSDDFDVRAFGYRPMWRGLVFDTSVFATLWFAGVWGFGVARSARRRRRGLCPKCAYALKGSAAGCPECGWARCEEHV